MVLQDAAIPDPNTIYESKVLLLALRAFGDPVGLRDREGLPEHAIWSS